MSKRETLDVDQIAATATQVDSIVSSLESESLVTIAIHIFFHLHNGDRGLDIPQLAAETGLSRVVVKSAIETLVTLGKIHPLIDNPNIFTINGGNDVSSKINSDPR